VYVNDKRASLLRFGVNYSCIMFYKTETKILRNDLCDYFVAKLFLENCYSQNMLKKNYFEIIF
jgi:hypothetical protein